MTTVTEERSIQRRWVGYRWDSMNQAQRERFLSDITWTLGQHHEVSQLIWRVLGR